MDAERLKAEACAAIDRKAEALAALSNDIWRQPETAFEEHAAHSTLTEFLEKQAGFSHIKPSYVHPTGFRAAAGTGTGPHVAVICEYDALPEIGHACGHNLIAEVGAGAALGVKAALNAAKDNGQELGSLSVIGTPAEEGEGGKLDFISQGAFDGVDAALMAHPWPANILSADGFLARVRVTVKYFGKASHAAGFPWEGINALDAAVMAYTSISVMRQQCKPTWRIHGVIVNGGVKPNIIPEETELDYCIRAPNMREVRILRDKAVACFQAAAEATGCKMELTWHPKPYENVLTNPSLVELYRSNAQDLGVKFPAGTGASGSTDMGNVSKVVPSIHPFFYIGAEVLNHTREFTAVAGDPKAQPYALQQAKALAMTAIDVFCRPELLPTIRLQFQQQLTEDQA